VIAALFILLITFGSLAAAGMPLITAGLGLITGVALIGLATRVTNMSNVAPDLALMIGLGVGIDYSLFIVTRFREDYAANGDVELSIVEAMDTSGRAILLAGATVVIALLGMFATGVAFMYGLAIAAVIAVLLVLDRVAHAAASAPLALRPPARAPERHQDEPVWSPSRTHDRHERVRGSGRGRLVSSPRAGGAGARRSRLTPGRSRSCRSR
jgi:uncharacterized membrane protein YdfJ with MMPL/SSD domain